MGTSIRQAQHDRPLSAADLELLRAVPAGACLPRRRPDTSAPVRSLPEAVVATAERARHAAWVSDSQPPWRPGMSVNSLRQTAAASTLTSHHCETLLRSLARGQRMAGEPGIALRAAADAVGRTRTRWLGIAHALDQVASSNQEPTVPGRSCGRRPRAVDRPPRLRQPRLDAGQRTGSRYRGRGRNVPGSPVR